MAKQQPTDAFMMMDRCHRQVERHMQRLHDASAALGRGDGGDDACDEVVEVLAYLNRSAHRHVADEEQSLFPRLRAAGVDDALLTRIEAEHRAHDQLHERLTANVRAWRTRPPSPALVADLQAIAGDLSAAYADHIDVEDRELLPLLRGVLSQSELDDVFAEMRARRGKSKASQGGKGRGLGGGKKRARTRA